MPVKVARSDTELVTRGGQEAHGAELMDHARALGLESADVVNVTTSLSPDNLRVLYRAADGVLANSGREPFGRVGLEAMAGGGTIYTGTTGEEYARHLDNAVVLDTADPAWYISYLAAHPVDQARLCAGGA